MKNTSPSPPPGHPGASGLSEHSQYTSPPTRPAPRGSALSTAQLVYDGTLMFCVRFVEPGKPAHDRLPQAARKALRNLAEAAQAADRLELKLDSMARACLEELRTGYEDHLHRNGLRPWPAHTPEAIALRCRCLSGAPATADPSDPFSLRSAPMVDAANTLLALIAHADRLLERRLRELEVGGPGLQNKAEAPRAARRQMLSDRNDAPAGPVPLCPLCGRPMRLRTARIGPNAGESFWGCSRYPGCGGTLPVTGRP